MDRAPFSNLRIPQHLHKRPPRHAVTIFIMKPSELMQTPVSNLLTDARAFSTDDRASAVIGYLRENGSYDAFTEDETRTCIVTLRDLLEVRDMETRLSTVMRQVPRLNTSNNVGDAASLMFEYRTRSMPVYKGKRLIGRITAAAIAGKLLDSDTGVKLADVMTPDPVTLDAGSSVSTAKELMRKKKFDQIPVMSDGRLVNVVTSADIVFNLSPRTDRDQKGDRRAERDADAVTRFGKGDVVTNDLKDSLREVYDNMQKNGANYSVILDAKGVRGIVTYRDLMKLLARKPQSPPVPMYIIGIPEDVYEANQVREKFGETVKLLTRVLPGVVEARAVIEGEGNNPAKKKNLVKVAVVTPRKQFSYKVFSFELSEAFDEVHAWAKRLVEQEKPDKKNSKTKRARTTSDFPQ